MNFEIHSFHISPYTSWQNFLHGSTPSFPLPEQISWKNTQHPSSDPIILGPKPLFFHQRPRWGPGIPLPSTSSGSADKFFGSGQLNSKKSHSTAKQITPLFLIFHPSETAHFLSRFLQQVFGVIPNKISQNILHSNINFLFFSSPSTP